MGQNKVLREQSSSSKNGNIPNDRLHSHKRCAWEDFSHYSAPAFGPAFGSSRLLLEICRTLSSNKFCRAKHIKKPARGWLFYMARMEGFEDRLVRSQVLYPAELHAHKSVFILVSYHFAPLSQTRSQTSETAQLH